MIIRRRPRTLFGQMLVTLRRQAYLSRELVAQRAGISVHLLQSLEQGRANNPTVQTMFCLVQALGVPFSELMDRIAEDLQARKSEQPTTDRGPEPVPSSS
jgi:transcriptional regulator with XRE-family HTH domain